MPLSYTEIYAATFGGCALIVIVAQCRHYLIALYSRWLVPLLSPLRYWAQRHLLYPHVLARHRLAGPWTRWGALLRVVYWTVHVVLICLRCNRWSEASRRGSQLATVNMAVLCLGWQLEAAASLLNISVEQYHQLHATIGWLVLCLIVFHASVTLWIRPWPIDYVSRQALSQITLAATTILIILRAAFSPAFRAFSWHIRAHQVLATTLLVALGIHMQEATWVCWTAWGTGAMFSLLWMCNIVGKVYSTGWQLAEVHVARFPPGFTLDVTLPLRSKVTPDHYLVVGRRSRRAQAFAVLNVEQRGTALVARLWGDKSQDWLDRTARVQAEAWKDNWLIQGPYYAPYPKPTTGRFVVIVTDANFARVQPMLRRILDDHRQFRNAVYNIRVGWFLDVKTLYPCPPPSVAHLARDGKHKEAAELHTEIFKKELVEILWPILNKNMDLNETIGLGDLESTGVDSKALENEKQEWSNPETPRHDEKESSEAIQLDKTLPLRFDLFVEGVDCPVPSRRSFFHSAVEPPPEKYNYNDPRLRSNSAPLGASEVNEAQDPKTSPPSSTPRGSSRTRALWLKSYLDHALPRQKKRVSSSAAEAGARETCLIVSATDDVHDLVRTEAISSTNNHLKLYEM